MSLVCAIGGVLGAWCVAAVACLGIGVLADRCLHPGPLDADRALMAFWVGLALLLCALPLWNLLLLVGSAAAGLAVAGGAAGLALERRRWLPLAAGLRRHRGLVALWLVLVLALANLSLAAVQHYDTGLYLWGAMDWAGAHRAPPGLGNLHGRFAFNNAHLLVAALFEAGPLDGRAANVVQGALLVALAPICLRSARRLVTGSGTASDAFALTMALPAAILGKIYLVSLSSDLPATLLAMLVAWRTFRIAAGEAKGSERGELYTLSLLAAATVTVKLSALVFVAGCWVVAAASVLPRLGLPRAALAAGLVVLALAPWLARGVVLSGYPVYPSTVVSLPVSWRLPESQAVREAEAVTSWARVPGVPRELTLTGWDWLESWTDRHMRLTLRPGFVLPLLVGALGLLAALLARSREPAGRGALALLLPCAAAIASWFWLAPAPRFALFAFWSVAGVGVALAVEASGRTGGRVAALALVALLAAAGPRALVAPGPEGGFHPLPPVATEPFETDSGLVLFVPVGGDQCWAAPQPCTPYPRRDLALRRPGDPASGFVRTASPSEEQR